MSTFLDLNNLSRRVIVGLAGTALAVVGLGVREALGGRRGKGKRRIFVLDPEHGTGDKGCGKNGRKAHKKGGGCHACIACHRHAENKRFASRRAADRGRAHKHCNCKIKSKSVSDQEFKRMFGQPGSLNFRQEFDKRW